MNILQSEEKRLEEILNMVHNDLSSLIYIEHLCGRIKSNDSIIQKLKKKDKEPTLTNAFDNLNDIIGLRAVVRFIDDIYKICEYIEDKYEVIIKKDYIKNPKENGYRSMHIIINIILEKKYWPVEIQIRTISQDSWASLEHKMKYKKEVEHFKLVSSELKKCADEMASVDIRMQAIKDMIIDGFESENI